MNAQARGVGNHVFYDIGLIRQGDVIGTFYPTPETVTDAPPLPALAISRVPD